MYIYIYIYNVCTSLFIPEHHVYYVTKRSQIIDWGLISWKIRTCSFTRLCGHLNLSVMGWLCFVFVVRHALLQSQSESDTYVNGNARHLYFILFPASSWLLRLHHETLYVYMLAYNTISCAKSWKLFFNKETSVYWIQERKLYGWN